MDNTIKHWAVITLIISIIGIIGITTVPNVYSADAWHNTSYDKRQWINVTNGSVMTDFQVFVTVTYDSDMQADFDDVKFYDIKGNRLDYWLHNKTDSTTAWFWVETNYSTFYMYYKNNTNDAGTSDSNGFNTFIIFDDWEDGDDSTLTTWSNGTVTGTPPEAAVELFGGSYVYNITAHPNDEYSKIAGTVPTENHVIGGSFYSLDEYALNTQYPTRVGTFEDTSNWFIDSFAQYDNDIDVAAVRTTFKGFVQHTASANPVLADSAWFTYEIVRNDTATTTATWLSAGKDNVANLAYQGTSTSADHDVNGSMNLFVARGTVSWDNVYLRKYMSPEPSIAFGSEETQSGGSGSSTELTVTLNNPDDSSTNASSDITFAYTALDNNASMEGCRLDADWSGSWAINATNSSEVNNNTQSTFYVVGIPEGSHEWTVVCWNDTYVTATNRSITIDTTAPSFTLNHPENTTYYKTNIDIAQGNYELPLFMSYNSSDANLVWYSLNGGTNTTFSGNNSINGTPGQNNITIWINDSVNNLDTTTIYFTINDTNHTVSETSYTTGTSAMTGFSIGDVNNDGDNEIIFGTAKTADPDIYVAYWNGTDYNISILRADVMGADGWVEGIRINDSDGNSNDDILFHAGSSGATNKFWVMNLTSEYVEDDSNSFDSASDGWHHGLAYGNLTGDGSIKMATSTCGDDDGQVVLYNMSYSGSWESVIADYTYHDADTIEADLNNDGRLEVIVLHNCWAEPQEIKSLLIDTDNTVGSTTTIYSEYNAGTEDIEVCDFDGDGIAESLAGVFLDSRDNPTEEWLIVYQWNGSGYTRTIVDNRVFATNGTIHGNYTVYHGNGCFDIDNDDRDEFVIGGQNWTAGTVKSSVLAYHFDDNFVAHRSYISTTTDTGWISHAMNLQPFGDADNDGDNDLLFSKTIGHTDAYRNDGTNYMVDLEYNILGADSTNPSITIEDPNNDTYTTTSISLNVAADETIDTWWYQHNSNGTNYTFTPNVTITGEQGQNNITVWANDTTGNENSSTVYFYVDTIPPTITVNSPTNTTYNTSVSLSVTTTTASSCVYNIGGSNSSLTGGPTSWTGTIPTGSMVNTTTYNFIVYCDDAYDNYAMNDTIWFTYEVQDSGIWYYNYTLVTTPTNYSETDAASFYIYVNINSSIYAHAYSVLYFNDEEMVSVTDGTYYLSSNVYEDYETITRRFEYDLPQIDSTSQEYELKWDLKLYYSNGTIQHIDTTTYNITVYKMIVNDTEPDEETIHFFIYDESTGSLIDNVSLDTTITLTVDNDTSRNYSFELNESNNYTFWIYPGWGEYWSDAVIEYIADGYTQRSRYIYDYLLTNDSQTVDLYLLDSASSDLVKILVKDSNYNNVPDVTVEIERYDVGAGTYTTMTVIETDSEGKALVYLETDTANYRFTLSEDGETKNIYGPMIIVDDGTTPIEQILYLEGATEEWFELVAGIDGSCTFDEDTNTTTCTGEDNTEDSYVNEWCLVIEQTEILTSTEVERNCTSGSTAEIEYDFGATPEGEYSWVFYAITDEYNYIVDIGSHDFTTGTVFGLWGVFIGFFVILALSIIGLFHPPVAGIFSVMGIVFAYWLGLTEVMLSSIGGLMIVAILIYIGGRK